jgi:hypothetical protein
MEALAQLQARIQELKKKVEEKRKAIAADQPDPEFRQMRKKLKRLQRKRRSILARGKRLQEAKDKPEKKAAVTTEKKETASEAKG